MPDTPTRTISFECALALVKKKLADAGLQPRREVVPLEAVGGRVLAEEVVADRDYPPFHRSLRDGYAVRAADVATPPVDLRLRGEIRAGGHFAGRMEAGECISIMTGAPLPAGADSVVMVEYTESPSDKVRIQRSVQAGEHVVRQGSEAAVGSPVLPRGKRLGAAEMGLLAMVGKSRVQVFARPTVAIIPTGDELVPVEGQPAWFQIRNSNAISLSAQVAAAGGIPHGLEIAPDRAGDLRTLIEEGLNADMLLLTGGVSAGKYDLVEQVLAELGAEFHFRSVAIRPGKPVVFGQAAGKFFFGLPGNPVSTYVTFALFARPALEVLGGGEFTPPLFLRARLARRFEQKVGLTMFVPARLERSSGETVVSQVSWQGSGDVVGVSAADCFLVIHPEQTTLAAGDGVDVMLK